MKKRPPLAERIKRGLQQAIAFERGEITLRTKEVKIPAPPQNLSADDITRIRKKLGYSQAVLAKVAAVSVQTVQGWERGARRPSGTASRLLQLLENPDLIKELVAVAN